MAGKISGPGSAHMPSPPGQSPGTTGGVKDGMPAGMMPGAGVSPTGPLPGMVKPGTPVK